MSMEDRIFLYTSYRLVRRPRVTARDVCYTSVNCSFREQRFVDSVYGTVSPLRNRFLPVIGSRTLSFRRRRTVGLS